MYRDRDRTAAEHGALRNLTVALVELCRAHQDAVRKLRNSCRSRSASSDTARATSPASELDALSVRHALVWVRSRAATACDARSSADFRYSVIRSTSSPSRYSARNV